VGSAKRTLVSDCRAVTIYEDAASSSVNPADAILLLAQGGVLVRAGDEVIAAIGVSGARGGDMDTQCARAGIERIRDRLR